MSALTRSVAAAMRVMLSDPFHRPHYPTRHARRDAPVWVQAQRQQAARAKRLRRRQRNATLRLAELLRQGQR